MKKSTSLSLTRYESQKALSTMALDEDREALASQILQFELLKTDIENMRSYSRADLIEVHKKCVDPTSAPCPLPLSMTKRFEATLKLSASTSAPNLATSTIPPASKATIKSLTISTTPGTAKGNGRAKTAKSTEEGSLATLPTKVKVLEKCMSTFSMMKPRVTAWFTDITIDNQLFSRVEVYGSDRGVAEIVLLQRIRSNPSTANVDLLASVSMDSRTLLNDIPIHDMNGALDGDSSLVSTFSRLKTTNTSAPSSSQVASRVNRMSMVGSRSNNVNIPSIDEGSMPVDPLAVGSTDAFSLPPTATATGRASTTGAVGAARRSTMRVSRDIRGATAASSADGDMLGQSSLPMSASLDSGVGFTAPVVVPVAPAVPVYNPADYVEVGRLVLTRDRILQFQLPPPPAQAEAKEFDQFFSDMDNGPTNEEIRVMWENWFSSVQYVLKIIRDETAPYERYVIDLRLPFVPVSMEGRKWDLALPPKKVDPPRPGRLPVLQATPKIKLDARKVYLFFRDT